MGKFFGELCKSVTVDGEEYAINTDFSVWMEIEHIILTADKKSGETLAKILALAYRRLPPNPLKAVEGLLWFYSAGEKPRGGGNGSEKPLYDLVLDFDYIWGAFLAEFGIDLSETRLHWWKFRALLACLGEDCRFSRIVGYRSMDTARIKNGDERRFYEKMKKRFELPDMRSEDEKQQAMVRNMELLF